ncbi:MAG: sigma-70 family RNA polymerase sigma factor [Bacteroidota bacterium]
MENRNICELFLENYEMLKEYSFKICKQRQMSQDITQEVFLSIHSRYSKDDNQIQNKLGFLYQAIKFSTYTELKKNNGKHELSDREFSVDPLRNDFLLEDLIRNSITEIPPQRRKVFYLRRILNFKIKEIAVMMNIKPKTVENHVTIAIRTLKKEYGHYINAVS